MASGLRFYFPDIGDLFLPGISLRYPFAGAFDHSTGIVGSLNSEPRLQQSWIDWNTVILSFFSKLQNCLIRQLLILTSTFCAKFERLSKACRRLVYCIFTMYLTNCIIGILYFIFILYF